MRWIDWLHRWTGALIGLLLAALGLSGTLLLYEDAWLRATVPHADERPISDVTAAIDVTERLTADPASRPSSILFPTDSLGLFRLSFPGGEGAYADRTGEIVLRWSSKWERAELWLFDFHHHLWAGEVGATTAGVLAMIGLGFVITGFILWWRMRRAFKLRVLPLRMSRLYIARHHRDLGAVTSPLLLIALLTGAMLTLRPVADYLFAPLSAPGTIAESLAPPNVQGGPIAENFDWRATLQSVHSAYPQAELRTISLPARAGQLIRIRVRQPDEWLPNGRTVFWIDPADGRIVEMRDAHALPLAARAFNIVYPLHASSVGGAIYKIAMTIAGFALTLLGTLAVYGFWSYRARRAAQDARLAEHANAH